MTGPGPFQKLHTRFQLGRSALIPRKAQGRVTADLSEAQKLRQDLHPVLPCLQFPGQQPLL